MTAPLPAGGRLDEAAPFTPVRVAVLTISDTRDEESDTSGHVLAERVKAAGHVLAGRDLVPDDVDAIRGRIKTWTTSGEIDAIVTTGGTGLTGRDVPPQAIEPPVHKRIHGLSLVFPLGD